MPLTNPPHVNHVRLRLPGLAAAMLLLAACASTPPPTDAMQRAQSTLDAARKAGAADYDPVDLDFAKGKFGQAQAAMAKRDYDKAAAFAAESLADGRLALTKARLAALRGQVKQASAENERLRQQLLNKTDTAPGGQGASSPPAAQGGDGATELPQQVLPMPGAPAPASSATGENGGGGI